MLADPQRSRVVLVNPARTLSLGATGERASRAAERLELLSTCHEWLAVPTFAIGEYDSDAMPSTFGAGVRHLGGQALDLWSDTQFTSDLEASAGHCIFLGGFWLDEDVLILALEGAWLGYDIRLLLDLSWPRQDGDLFLTIQRLMLHGVIPTNVRQMLLEWTVHTGNRDLRDKVMRLLG
ncbi:MAG TPA: hypothetical protein VF499_14840 [Afipia sp.]